MIRSRWLFARSQVREQSTSDAFRPEVRPFDRCQSVRGHGLGKILLMNALRLAWQTSEYVGAFAVKVLAINDEA